MVNVSDKICFYMFFPIFVVASFPENFYLSNLFLQCFWFLSFLQTRIQTPDFSYNMIRIQIINIVIILNFSLTKAKLPGYFFFLYNLVDISGIQYIGYTFKEWSLKCLPYYYLHVCFGFQCVKFVFSHGVMTEGIYRLAGVNTKINKLLSQFRYIYLFLLFIY